MLTCPSWIELNDQDKQRPGFIWDDARIMEDFTGDPAPVLRASMKMSLRARIVLCMGLYEWVVWRFEGLHSSKEPLQIAEVGWCATVDPRYLRFFELTREEWVGPVDGPLWCAATWLQPALSQGHSFPKTVYQAISFLTRMGMHVMSDGDGFQAWLEAIPGRLAEMYPLTPEDPFEDLFDRRISQRLGPLIGRNVLDPSADPVAEQSAKFLTQNLQEARDSGNPFLASPDDLEESGFVDVPYVLTPP